jgi:hypothetical protein
MTNPSNPKPVTHDEATESLHRVLGWAPGGARDRELRQLMAYLRQQRALSATRKADAETVRHALTHSVTTAEHDRALEALDRLGKE